MNNNGWTTVNRKKGRPNKTLKKNANKAKKNANNLKKTEKARKNKILYNFFHYEELPDELLMMANNTNNTNNTNNNTEPELEPEILDDIYKERVQHALVKFFKDGYIKNIADGEPTSDEIILEYINSILIRYNIKISGGFILKSMGLFEGNSGAGSIDIDIYLPYINSKTKNIPKRIHDLLSNLFNTDIINGKKQFKYFKVTHGAKSAFFKKNGIYSVTKYSKMPNSEMDLVQADYSTTPINIIKRFDLSFCQNWYDGENVWSMDKSAILKEDVGTLEDDYVEIYLAGNPVTKKRIKKYIQRGFRVKYRNPETNDMIEITLDDLKNV